MITQQEVTGSSWRPTVALAPGVVWWRVRGLGAGSAVVWSSATWEFVVGRRDAPVDTSFGTVKDFNGDGYDDIATSGYLAGSTDSIYIYHGRTGAGSSEPSENIPTDPSPYRMAAGDFNGDGFADLASTNVDNATLQVRYGSRTGLPREASLVLRQSGGLSGFAHDLTVGDVDGDGFSDLVTLSRTGADPSLWAQRFEVFLGGERGLVATPASTIVPPMDYIPGVVGSANFEVAGDVNADGYTDLLTSWEEWADASGRQIGRSWLVAGHPTLPLHSWITLSPPTGAGNFGGSVAGVGDLDGDGIADFAIRSNEEVSIYLGSAGVFTTRPVRTIENPEGRCYIARFGFGSALGGPGDYNGDGRADLAIGARCLPYTGKALRPGPGSAFVYPGQVGGVFAAPTVFRGMYRESNFGGTLGGVGDFNGDGFGDLAILQPAPTSAGGRYIPPTLFVLPASAEGASLSMAWVFAGTWTRFWYVLAASDVLSQTTGG